MNDLGASVPDKSSKGESSAIKVKLKLHLTFRTVTTSQSDKADDYNNGNHDSEKYDNDFFASELSAATIDFDDPDDDGYDRVEIREYCIGENSAKVMDEVSQQIDRYVRSWCNDSNVEVVLPCFYVPSFSVDILTPKLFFYLYTPSFLLEKKTKRKNLHKISYDKAYIASYFIDDIQQNGKRNISVKKSLVKEQIKYAMSADHIKMFALTSYYSYLYHDLFEREAWSWFKDSEKLWSKDKITEAVEKYLSEKNSEPASFWTKTWRNVCKVCDSIAKVMTKIPSLFIDSLTLMYDKNLINRIYTRILDLLYITSGASDDVELYAKTIRDILEKCRKEGTVGVYEFYDMCGYWDYLKGGRLQKARDYDDSTLGSELTSLMRYCRQWECSSIEKLENKGQSSFVGKALGKLKDFGEWLTGYGAVLYENPQTQEYIYCFKGTDFDSVVKDWITTNFAQGLTGLSLQHVNAARCARKLDELLQDKNLWFTGHSLGGGLASAATIATKNRVGYTFNAAGLNILGITVNQIFHGSKESRRRVFPYRIKGEILDGVQKLVSDLFAKINVTYLERGYGEGSLDYDIDNRVSACGAKHGINNFLFREVMNELDVYKIVESDDNELEKGKLKIIYHSKYTEIAVNI